MAATTTSVPDDIKALQDANPGCIDGLEKLPDGVLEGVYEDPPTYDAAQATDMKAVFAEFGIPEIYEFTKSDGTKTKKVYNIWEDLQAVMAADIYVVADDSGSMTEEVKDGKGNVIGTRWDELKETLRGVIKLAVALDKGGITVHFLNRGRFDGITSLEQIEAQFTDGPGGYTPLEAVCKEAMDTRDQSKHLLLLVTSDGEPNYLGDDNKVHRDKNATRFKNLLAGRNNDSAVAEVSYIFVNLLACTDDVADIGWMNGVDVLDATLDTLDDYYSEKQQVKGIQGLKFKYSKGLHLARFFLGAFFKHYDEMDEKA